MTTTGNHVIFVHPDGTSPSHYALARFVDLGPDGRLNWDNLDHAGVYLGHMEDQLGGTSNGGAVTHATGAKVFAESFGFEADGSPITSLAGTETTIVEDAIAANKVTALLQSGAIFEPGTAAFVAKTAEIEVDGNRIVPRSQVADIAKQVIESGVDFIMGGGEATLLPVGTDGFHGTAEELDALSTNPLFRPSENLIELAENLGYTVVYTAEQLRGLLDLPTPPTKVLGVFAPIHTFNDRSEEVLAERDLPLYLETAPTIAEMLEVTQALMKLHPNFDNGSITILEEEGTDNFGNNNNAAGVLEAMRRADEAIGVALDFVEENPNTLIITAADSDAGGLQVRDPRNAGQNVGTINNNPIDSSGDRNVPLDGQTGADTLPFVSAPDANGDQFNFAVGWAGLPDFSGSIVSKAHGLNADKLPATLDNTKIYELMYETLFDTELEARNEEEIAPAPEATANTGNVIFIHPDGTSPSHFMALRNIDLGPDGRLNWDKMSDAGVYLGHMENQLTGTSNAGAVTHATGVKVFNESFGLEEDNTLVNPASGKLGYTILEEAIEAGKATALIQSGHIGEPGTAAFAAATTNRDGDDVRARDKTAEIAEQVIRSGTQIIMAGGEVYLLPQGTTGFHVTAEIDEAFSDAPDRPSINLIELAESLGYTVVYTKEQMNAAVATATASTKLLGVFAANHTFDDRREESLGLNTANPLPLYVDTAPTVAEMLEASLQILSQDPDGFFVVVEEEGTDNFGNNNNAVGTIEALRRADAAIGVAMDFVNTQDPNTLVITAADSDAGGMQVYQFAPYSRPSGNFDASNPILAEEQPEVPFITVNRTTENNTRVYLDGPEGSTATEGEPWTSFSAVDSIDGPMGNFGIAWVGTPDFPGSIVSKAYGMNADLLPSTLDNTEIYKLMYKTLFGELPTGNFNRIASFVVASQIEPNSNTDEETSAEIVASSMDGNTLIYSNSPQGTVGFVDITDPSNPLPLGEIDVDGEPTSVTVKGNYVLVAVNTSEDFVNPSGQLRAIDLSTQTIVKSWDIGGQPDSIAVSPDGNYAVIAIENERDEDFGDGGLPQLPAGFVVIVDTSDADLNNWTTTVVDLTNLNGVTVPEDPEPEFVDISSDNIAAVTLQENNAIVLIDLETKSVIRSFSAGTVDLTGIDTEDERPNIIDQTSSLNDVPREPDGITFIGTDYIATADEGDWLGGSRGFTIYDLEGNVVYTSGNEMDRIAAQLGHYPDRRSDAKGNEPENIEFATYNDTDYLFVNSERSSLVFVYNVNDPTNPIFEQVLPAGVAPEGGKAIPGRNLLAVASEADSRGDVIRSVINIYEYSNAPASYPDIQSAMGENGVPIPWGAMSGLAAGSENTLYAIEDSFYGSNRFFTIDTTTAPSTITSATTIKDTNDIFSALRPDLVNDDADKTVNIDPEGIAATGDGSLWIASEGAGAAGEDGQILNYLFKVNATDGAIEEVITLPDEINAKQIRFGLEGVAYDNGQLVVVLQRAWTGDANPRVLVYDTNDSEWVGDYFYPLDAVESQNGGWVGLSDISPLGNGNFLVLERDNQGGPDAAVKRLYSINLSEAENGDTLQKQFVRDLIPAFTATGGLMPEKLEGLAVTEDAIWVINDNDGVNDNSGETQLIKLDFGTRIGETTALIPQAGSSTLPEHLLDGGSGDTDFPYGNFKALATVGEIDPNTGHVLTGYPDGQAAWLVDEDTVRVVYQSESYATLSNETYPWVMSNGAKFTGSHIHTIDYNREGFANFLNNDNAASEIFEGSGNLFDTVYNVFGEIVTGKNTDQTDLAAKWGNQTSADGTVNEFTEEFQLTQGDWFFHSFCGAHYEPIHKYGEGIGFEDDVWFMAEEWNIGDMFAGGEEFFINNTMGLASMVVDIANEIAYTVPVLGQSGYEKILPINSGHEDYVVLVMSGYNLEVEPAPLRIYIGKKDMDASGNVIDYGTASERDAFLARNGLLFGQLYGMAATDETYAALGITEVDADTEMLNAYAKNGQAPDNFSVRYYATSYQWDGFDTPENAGETEVYKWLQDGDNGEANEQPEGYTFFNGDSKVEHPAVDPDINNSRYVINLTDASAILGIDFSNIVNDLENDLDGNGLPDYLSADVTRIVAGVDGALTLETNGKGLGHQSSDLNPDGTLTHSIHIEAGEARLNQPDGLQWVKTSDGDYLILDEDSGNDAGERKMILPINSDDLQLTEANTGYFLASAGGSDNPRALAGVAAIPGTFTRATGSEFSGTWNVTHLVERKEDGSFYTQEEIAGTGAQEIIGSVHLNEQTFIGVVQHSGESSGLVAERLADQGGQIFMFNVDLNVDEPFTLQLLHASDQEAGIPALQDAIGFSAVLNALDAQYENTLKLSSGDLFIAGPFFNASIDIYGRQGIADILIQNELGWDAAAVGNHEFDAGTSAFYNAIAPNASIQGTGIDPNTGFTGANFPYLATNLDYSTDSSNLKNLVVDSGEAPKPASLTESVVIDVNGEQIGVIGAVVPYLPQIANIGGITMLTNPNSRDIEANAQAIADSVQPFVDELVAQGINKIVLMTHLQQFEVEQALASKLRHVDILMGGGSHRVMANDDDTLRQDETQTPPELLQPYPQVFQDADGNDIYLVNTGANYRYVGQLIVDFDADGNIISIGDESGAYATDIAGVDRLYDEDITTFDQVKAVADPELVEIVDGVGDFIDSKDSNIFGNTEVWLNGLRSSVRTEETNLGNLTADANLWYAEQYGFDIDISVKNGGGIRDQIGVSFIDGGTNELVQLPPQANPPVGKEEGDVSQLDIENSLRFDNKLSVADISAQGIKDLAEHFVASWAIGSGQFGQIGGFSFSFDPDNTPIVFTRDGNGDATGVATPGQRIQNLVLNREDGTQEAIVLDGELVVDPDTSYKMVILDFLAGGGDGYPVFYFNNIIKLADLNPDGLPNNSNLPIAGEQDALAEYLAEFFPDATQAFDEADTPIAQDTRIQNLNFRDDTIIENPEPEQPRTLTTSGSAGNDFLDAAFGDNGFTGESQILFTGTGNDEIDLSVTGEGNRIDTGSGNDTLFTGTNNRIILGAGNDILFAGSGNGGNRISGGIGADQFWLLTDEGSIPENANIISDFNSEEGDVIGFLNTTLSLNSKGVDWNYVQNGNNVLISAFGQEIGQLLNTTISDNNFVFR